jgi:hypothetical protein
MGTSPIETKTGEDGKQLLTVDEPQTEKDGMSCDVPS